MSPPNLAKMDDLRDSRGLLVLLRHGLSMWNRNPKAPNAVWRYAGSSDVALAATGIEEALLAGERLSTIPIDFMFSSNLSRATNTGTIALSKHTSERTPVVLDRNGDFESAMAAFDKLPSKEAILP
jgi:bisphosphoglycerate-dependent phosphoglycerate mutase